MNHKSIDSFLNNTMVIMIIVAYVALVFFLFNFWSGSVDSGMKIISSEGQIYTYVTNPYKFYNNINGVIYTLIFGFGGGILLYVFLLSPSISAMNMNFRSKFTPDMRQFDSSRIKTGAEQLHFIPEDAVEVNNEVMRITSDGIMQYSAIKQFIKKFASMALMFAFRKNMDGSPLDIDTLKLFMQWENNGLNKEMVTTEVKKMLEINYIGPEANLIDLKQKIDEAFEREQKIKESLAIH